MKLEHKPARLLSAGDLIVANLSDPVLRVTKVEYPLPQNTVVTTVTDQLTGDELARSFEWEQEVTTTRGLVRTVGTGEISVELAQYRDDTDRAVFRYRIRDLESGIDVTDADVRSGVVQRPDNRRALSALVSFLEAAGESYLASLTGASSDNTDLFPQEVCIWAYQNDAELQTLALELDPMGLDGSR